MRAPGLWSISLSVAGTHESWLEPGTPMPAVPVLPTTLLGLELLLGQRALELGAMRDLVCEDPGALLHLFALVGEEYRDAPDRPTRLEECLASVSAERLLRTLAGAGGSRQGGTAFAHFAAHAAAVGRSAQLVADSLGLPRELAHAVGTLHELGTLPALLGWQSPTLPAQASVRHCQALGRAYRLPRELRSALDAVHGAEPGSVWPAVVAAAHDLLCSR